MHTTGRVLSFDDKRALELEVTLDDGTTLPAKSCGCFHATTAAECLDAIKRRIRAREIHSARGQELHKERMAAEYPMEVFG